MKTGAGAASAQMARRNSIRSVGDSPNLLKVGWAHSLEVATVLARISEAEVEAFGGILVVDWRGETIMVSIWEFEDIFEAEERIWELFLPLSCLRKTWIAASTKTLLEGLWFCVTKNCWESG